METLLQDIRYGFRTMRKAPVLTAILVVTVALGVGVNTATFSLVNGILIRSLPVPAPQQLMVLAVDDKNSPIGALGFSYPAFAAFREQTTASCEMFGQTFTGPLGLTAQDHTDQVSMVAVSSNYFSGLGVKPALGSLILPNEGEAPGEQPVLVLGHSYWEKRFGGDPSIVGKQVRIDGKLVEVIGVVPKEFHGSFSAFELDGYVPFSTIYPNDTKSSFWTNRNSHGIAAMGRLKAGVSRTQAQSLFDVIAKRQADQYPASDKGFSVRVIPEKMARPVAYANTAFLLISSLFLVLSAIVLLLACTNVANILMARMAARMREMGVRTALGASRGRLLRQMLTESVLLAILGGVFGMLLGAAASRITGSIHFAAFPLQLDFKFDWLVFAYTFGLVIMVGILVGISPARSACRADINVVLHQGNGQYGGRHRLRKDLMVAQVAGSLMLLIVAGLFVRSLQRVGQIDLGFTPEHLLNIALDPRQNNYDEVRAKGFYRELETNIRALPGIESVSLASSVPITSLPSRQRVYPEGMPLPPDKLPPTILFNSVDEDYFKTMKIPLLLGRIFSISDDETSSPVAIVNQTMAARFWPQENPIGKRFRIKEETGPFLEVVGVVKDNKYQTIAEEAQPYFYVPLEQNFVPLQVLQLRSSIPFDTLTSQVQQQIHTLDPAMPIVDLRTMEESLSGASGFFIFRFGASVAALIGTIGLILAVVGVYGVVSYGVAQRTQEIGIRIALGGNRRQVLRLILNQGLKIVLGGVLVGLLATWTLAQAMTHLLVGVSPSDPVVYFGITTLLASVALLACYIPARRAAKVDPMVALRYE